MVRILLSQSFRFCFFLVASAFTSTVFAAPPFVIPASGVSVINISKTFEYSREISEAVPIGKTFEANPGVTVHHAFSKTPAWFRLQYRYASDAAEQAVLSLGNYTFVQVDFYTVQNGEITGELHTGAIKPFETRYLKLRDFTFPLPVSIEDAEIYVRIQSSTPLNFTPRIRSLNETLQKENTDQILGGLLFGAQAILILYNFFLFLSLRDRSYLFYSLYITGWLLFETKTTGFLARYVLYAAPGVDVLILPGIVFFTLAAFVLFTEHFLYADAPTRLHRWVRRCAGTVVLFSLPAIFLPQHIMVPAGIPVNLLVTAYVTWCAFRSWRMKKPSAGYFLIAVFCSILLLPLFALTRVIPLTVGFSFLSFVFHYGVPMILLVEALLLSFALADRYRRLREDKIRQEAEFAQMLAGEKDRINAELHDVIGSDLSLMRFSLGNGKKKPRAGDLQGKLDKTLLRLRELVALNNIEADLPAQLAHKLTLRSRELADATGMKLNADIEEIPLDVLAAFHIERFFAEALTNAARHAQASTIKIRFKKRSRYLILTVADDGRGMLRKRKPELTGSGLRNFAERAKRLDARFRIFTRLRKGTVVALLLKDYGKK